MPPRKTAAAKPAAAPRKKAAPKAKPKKMGRPSTYTDQIAHEICQRMALGETVARICRDDHLPQEWCIYNWRKKRPEFAQAFAHARVDQMHAWADQIITLADDDSADFSVTLELDSDELLRIEENGKVTLTYKKRHIARTRVMIDTRQWLMTRVDPESFGDKSTLNVNVAYEDKDDAELQAELRIAAERAGITAEQMLQMLGVGGVEQ